MPGKYNRLIVAAYRLPFKISKKGNTGKALQNAGGLVSAILSLASKYEKSRLDIPEILWAGCTDTETKEQEIQKLTDNVSVYPIFIEQKITDKYYNGFCNNTIWPLFHYYPYLAIFDETFYNSYQAANKTFYKQLKKIIQPGDIIWIHDYQLFLLPQMIRNDFPDTTIGFFLHIPFPSYEVFRILPKQWREELLKGMLGADLVGMHTNDYVDYFLKSVHRLLGFEANLRNILTKDRLARADAFPISIDFNKFNEAYDKPEVQEQRAKIHESLKGRKIIFSVDRLDYSKGILHRLQGFKLFLKNHPEWHEKVTFIMVIVPSRDSIARYREMKREIEELVGTINGRYGSIEWTPVVYQYKSLEFNELAALYGAGDVALITPIRDGMNLVSKEYVASKKDKKGVLILSEMAGAAAELGESILIHPSDKNEIAQAIHTALTLPPYEQMQRMETMQNRLKTYNVFKWADDFITQLEKVKQEQSRMKVNRVDTVIQHKIITHYKNAKKRILFLDYDGTLVPFAKHPAQATPNKEVLQLLQMLAEPKKNTVVLISGRDKNTLDKWFPDLQLNIIAEHGASTKRTNENWEHKKIINVEWKKVLLPILKNYTERCNGSFLEEKEFSFAWHYRNSEPSFSFIKAKELYEELNSLVTPDMNLHIMEGNKVLEIKSAHYDKGKAAMRFLAAGDYDFILAIGDDKTDEDMFKALPAHAYSVKVGITPSQARFYLQSQHEVLNLLKELVVSGQE